MSYEVFENVDYENLESLFKLARKDFRNISDIKLNYSKNHGFLQENLNFLIEIEIFKVTNNFHYNMIGHITFFRTEGKQYLIGLISL